MYFLVCALLHMCWYVSLCCVHQILSCGSKCSLLPCRQSYIFTMLLTNIPQTGENQYFSFCLRGVLASSNLLVYCKSILWASVTVFCRASLQPPDLWKPPLTVDCSDWAGTAASHSLCQRPAPHWSCPRCWCSFLHSKSAFSSSGSACVHLSLPEEVF